MKFSSLNNAAILASIAVVLAAVVSVESFRPTVPISVSSNSRTIARTVTSGNHHHQPLAFFVPSKLSASSSSHSDEVPRLKQVPPEFEGVPLPFIDQEGNNFIECYADSIAFVNGKEYTIGVPCDYAVALCYFDQDEDQLVPVELDDELMDDVFPVAESIVAEEFGEELVLQRTPQTLTLVGELEEDEEEFEEDDDVEGDEEDADDEEEVEVLLSFDHRGTEYNLVRLLDPILLVGRKDETSKADNDCRILLSPEESDAVMPILEDLFLQFHEDPDAMMP